METLHCKTKYIGARQSVEGMQHNKDQNYKKNLLDINLHLIKEGNPDDEDKETLKGSLKGMIDSLYDKK